MSEPEQVTAYRNPDTRSWAHSPYVIEHIDTLTAQLAEMTRARDTLAQIVERVRTLPLHIPDGNDEHGRWKWQTTDDWTFWGDLTAYVASRDILAALATREGA